jgi:predicted dehydrogenase/nucleoside-diphosphate-sugar epimerase
VTVGVRNTIVAKNLSEMVTKTENRALTPTRVACIGAGNIAETHAAAIRSIPGLELVAVVDPVMARATAFANKWGAAKTYSNVAAMLADCPVDVAHVLVPPPLHQPVAEPLLRAAVAVFLEKPMAQSDAECAALQDAAAATGVALRINHNFVHHPAQIQAKVMLAAQRIGPLRHVEMRFNMPLRQLAARQLGHWMFDVPLNLLLEQVVHPLAQIDDLLGATLEIGVMPQPKLRIGEGQEIQRSWLISLRCERGTAQLLASLGQAYPSWSAALVGDDGIIVADYLANRVTIETSGRYPDFFDAFRNGWRIGFAAQRQASAGLFTYAAAMVKLRPRSDVFFLSMKESIAAFHRDRQAGHGDLSGAEGRRMVVICETIAALGPPPSAPATASVTTAVVAADAPAVLVIGGTGFIGAHVVARILARGRRVRVLARNVANLPSLFTHPGVTLIRGNARDRDDVMRAIGSATAVVNLAHGGGGGSRDEVEQSLVGAARNVAECCLAGGVGRLVFVSSIASLYLGNRREVITGATPPDPQFEDRGDYARAKAIAERTMLEMHRTAGLPVTILRPGVVVGAGSGAFHSGFGFFNHERHCMGWNRGTNPLPLVLVEDTADAIVNALDAVGIDGKCYNLVGDVRLSARETIAALAEVTGRDLRYHGQSVVKFYGIEMMKAAVKRAAGRRDPLPSFRDLKSRGLDAVFDCGDAMRDLAWRPVSDRDEFLRRGVQIHGNGG